MSDNIIAIQNSTRAKKVSSSIIPSGDRNQRFKQFVQEVDYLKKVQFKLKGIDNKVIIELQANKCSGQEFIQYYSTFQLKFAERCQKKWSKKDKCMLLWVIVKYIQMKGKKSIEDLNQNDYEELQEILGIKKQMIIQQISQIICLKTSKNPFSAEEKNKLIELLKVYEGKTINWCSVAQQFNNSFENSQTLRTIKALKQVYINHLNPLLNKNTWSNEEDIKLICIIQRLGKKWQQAANIMKTRNQCQVKNQYYKLLREQMHREKLCASKKLDLESELQILERYKVQIMKQENIKEIDLDFDAHSLPSHIVAPVLSHSNSDNNNKSSSSSPNLIKIDLQSQNNQQQQLSSSDYSNQSSSQIYEEQFENYNLQQQQIEYDEAEDQGNQNYEQNYNDYSNYVYQQDNLKYDDQQSSDNHDLDTQPNIESHGVDGMRSSQQFEQNVEAGANNQFGEIQLQRDYSFLSQNQSPRNNQQFSEFQTIIPVYCKQEEQDYYQEQQYQSQQQQQQDLYNNDVKQEFCQQEENYPNFSNYQNNNNNEINNFQADQNNLNIAQFYYQSSSNNNNNQIQLLNNNNNYYQDDNYYNNNNLNYNQMVEPFSYLQDNFMQQQQQQQQVQHQFVSQSSKDEEDIFFQVYQQ